MLLSEVPFWNLVGIGIALIVLSGIIWVLVRIWAQIVHDSRRAFGGIPERQPVQPVAPLAQPVYTPPVQPGYTGNGLPSQYPRE